MRSAAVILSTAVLCSAASYSLAAPFSDGSIYKETFTSYPEDIRSSATSEATVAGGAVGIVTTDGGSGTEGLFRVTNLSLSDTAEYVIQYDFTLNAESGNNWYILYNNSDVGFSDITIRSYGTNNGGLGYNIQVDHGGGFQAFETGFLFGVNYDVTVHHKGDGFIDLYVDNNLLGTYTDRAPNQITNLMQFGDPSSNDGFGNMTIDNVSIGIPEPTSLAVIGLLGMAALRRRR